MSSSQLIRYVARRHHHQSSLSDNSKFYVIVCEIVEEFRAQFGLMHTYTRVLYGSVYPVYLINKSFQSHQHTDDEIDTRACVRLFPKQVSLHGEPYYYWYNEQNPSLEWKGKTRRYTKPSELKVFALFAEYRIIPAEKRLWQYLFTRSSSTLCPLLFALPAISHKLVVMEVRLATRGRGTIRSFL